MITISIILAILMCLTFLTIGASRFNQIKTKLDFFSASSSLERRQISRAILAANVSLSAGVAWFVGRGSEVGVFILFGPITIYTGILLNSYFVNKYITPSSFGQEQSYSLYTYVGNWFSNKLLVFLMIGATSIGSLTILLLEIHIGIKVLDVMTGDLPINGNYILMFLVAVATLYAILGGLRGIVRNDGIQNFVVYAFIFASVVALMVFMNNVGNKPLSFHLIRADAWEKEFNIGLIVWLFFVNTFFIPSQLRFWQLAGASKNKIEFVEGVRNSALLTGAVWALLAMVGVLFSYRLDIHTNDLPEIINNLLNLGAGLAYFLILPLLFLACISAFVSTADSAIISLSQVASDLSPFNLNKVWQFRILVLGIGILATAAYYLVFNALGTNFEAVLFSAFGLFILIAPPIVFNRLFMTVRNNKLFETCACIGLLVSGSGMVVLTYFPQFIFGREQFIAGPWVGSISFILSLLFCCMGLLLSRMGKRKL